MNKQELKKEFWRNEKKINGRKLTRQEKAVLRRRNREIMEMFGSKSVNNK